MYLEWEGSNMQNMEYSHVCDRVSQRQDGDCLTLRVW